MDHSRACNLRPGGTQSLMRCRSLSAEPPGSRVGACRAVRQMTRSMGPLVVLGAADAPVQAVVDRRDVHRRLASGVSEGGVAEEGHVVHPAQHCGREIVAARTGLDPQPPQAALRTRQTPARRRRQGAWQRAGLGFASRRARRRDRVMRSASAPLRHKSAWASGPGGAVGPRRGPGRGPRPRMARMHLSHRAPGQPSAGRVALPEKPLGRTQGHRLSQIGPFLDTASRRHSVGKPTPEVNLPTTACARLRSRSRRDVMVVSQPAGLFMFSASWAASGSTSCARHLLRRPAIR